MMVKTFFVSKKNIKFEQTVRGHSNILCPAGLHSVPFEFMQIFMLPLGCRDYIVTLLYVPYVQVQHRQLGVTRLLGVKLLVYRQRLYL